MKQTKHSRKDFLKQLGLLTGAVLATGFTNESGNTIQYNDFSIEKKEFLNDYAVWLKEFNSFIEIQKKEKNNFENNRKLMGLAHEAEKRRPMLEEYMRDENFAIYFAAITQQITKSI